MKLLQPNSRLTFKFFWRLVKTEKLTYVLKNIALVVAVVFSMAWVIVFGQFFDALTMDIEKSAIIGELLRLLGLIIVIDLIEFAGWRAAGYLNNFFQPKIMTKIATECFDYLHKHSYGFFSNKFTGSLVKKINKMVRAFEVIEDKIYWDMTPLFLRIAMILAVLFFVHPLLGVIMLVWTTIFIVANYYISIYKFRWDIDAAAAETKITARLADTITNSATVKLFAGHKFELRRFMSLSERWRKKAKKAWDIGSHIEAGQGLFMILFEVVILYSSIRLWQNDIIGISEFFIIQAYIFEMFHQLWNFGRNIRDIYESLADAEEMIEILNEPHEIKDRPKAKPIRINSGKITFDRVHFSYEDDTSNVIKNLSFAIKPGEKVALIGPSGGGKTTLVKLLLRFHDVKKGKIIIDSQSIKNVTQESLRKNVTMVPQDPILFHRSLRENIRYGRRNASDQEVVAASKMAHCHEFIQKLPKKYETLVGERGIKLSGGQKQRIAIARAILANPKILILDEATSSLDSQSETLIQKALQNLIKNKTTLIIAHRLSTIMEVDRIFVLKDGKIIEEGRHADLVTKKSSLYKKLWDLQVGGYLNN